MKSAMNISRKEEPRIVPASMIESLLTKFSFFIWMDCNSQIKI